MPSLQIQYADYAQWQRQWLPGEVLQGQLEYWKRHLQARLRCWSCRRIERGRRCRVIAVGSIEVLLGKELSTGLKELARGLDATLYMVLYAGWSMVLSRLSGQEDIVLGTPVANRQRAELEGLIGFFVNTLAVRTAVEGGWSVERTG